MKLRLKALLKERKMTAYGLARASGGRISMSAAYRLWRDEWDCLPRDILAALCDILKVAPGDLFDDGRRIPYTPIKSVSLLRGVHD